MPVEVHVIVSALETLAWLALLWYGAGLFSPARRVDAANRIRDTLFLAVCSAFGLALLGLFYPASCFGIAAAIAAFRLSRDRRFPRSVRTSGNSEAFAHVLPVVAAAVVSWPGIVRPILDGDSLGYHLPNAASWANAHSLWTTATMYWWYPPGSELFASALFLIGGPTVLGVAGLAALLLLALRVEAFA